MEQFITELPPTTHSQRRIMRIVNNGYAIREDTKIESLPGLFYPRQNVNFDVKYLRAHGLLTIHLANDHRYFEKPGNVIEDGNVVSPTIDGTAFNRWYRHELFGKLWWSILLPAFISGAVAFLVWVIQNH